MSTPIKTQIIDRIEADIRATGQFAVVLRNKANPRLLRQYPACCIYPDRETGAPRSDGRMARELTVMIEVICTSSAAAPDSAAAATGAAVEEALEQDRSLGGLADHCWQVATRYYGSQTDRPLAGCVMTWRVAYRRPRAEM